MPDGVEDYLPAPVVMRELGITRQRLAGLRKQGAFGEDGCRYDDKAGVWTYRSGAVELMRLWRQEVYDRRANPWPPWSTRNPAIRMPDDQPKRKDTPDD